MVPRVAACILAALPVVAGCGSKRPQITIDSASLQQRTDEVSLVLLQVTVENPSEGEVVLDRFRYRVRADGEFSGERQAMLTLAPKQSGRITLPAVVGPDPRGVEAAVDGTLTYRPRGNDVEEALYDSGLWRPKARFAGAAPVR